MTIVEILLIIAGGYIACYINNFDKIWRARK